MGYTELKSYTHYSFLRGASSPERLIREALKLRLEGLAITDLGGVYGLPKAHHTLQEFLLKEQELNKDQLLRLKKFRLICGSEVPLKNELHSSFVMLAPDREAYGAMCRILTKAHADEAKGTGALTEAHFFSLLNSIPHAEKILIFPQWEETWFQTRDEDAILKKWGKWRELKNALFFPLSKALDGLDQERTQFALKLKKNLDATLVAHQDVYYHHKSAQIIQDTLTSIREGIPLKDLGLKLKRNSERRLKSQDEMERLFSDLPELLTQTEIIREQCTFSMSELRYQYPSEWIPSHHTAQSYLAFLCEAGTKWRYPKGATDEILKQLHYELRLIEELRFADYFLTVYDIVDYARSKNILCQGRGSAANSIVCYVLGITEIDPIRMNFLFERFISVERGEPPDIDVDFEHERREEVIQYIYEKYGRHRAAMVAAVVTYRSRSALREVAKAFSLPVGTLSARIVEKDLMNDPILSLEKKQKIETVVDEILDYPRHLSIHSGGFTLSADAIDTIVPIEPATMEGRTIVQWDKHDLDVLGLLKIDVLSLGMLSMIRKNLDLIGVKEMQDIPQEDEKTYEMIGRADTIGVFQIESRAQMSMLPRLKPKSFYDLVVEIALVRPGPIVGKMVHPYLQRRLQKEPVVMPHPSLGPILGRTFGVPIFQEQVMKMAVVLAGFTPGEADRLRRAIGAWRSKGSIDEMGNKLMRGLLKAGLPESFCRQIFDQIQGFSEYGFPESHAASFALLTYVSCYLKCHHPGAFLCSLLNSQPMGFYSPHSLVDDAKRHGVKVYGVSVNHSDWDCTMEDANTVRLGFRYIRAFSEDQGKQIASERKNRPFLKFQDFVSRTHCDLRALRGLAMSGAFECFGLSARDALFEVLALHPDLFQQDEVQSELFPKTQLPLMTLEEQVVQDYRSLTLSARCHPMVFLRQRLLSGIKTKKNAHFTSQSVKAFKHGSWAILPGLSVVLQRPPTAKGTAFATLEDEEGVLDLIFHRDIFQKYKHVIRDEAFFWVKGILQSNGDSSQLLVKSLDPIFSDLEMPIAPGAHAKRHLR